MMRFVAFAGLAAVAQSVAVELTPSNFDAEVFESGKNAFVKFLAVCTPILQQRTTLPRLLAYVSVMCV